MTSKVRKSNGQVIYTSTYHPLTDDEMADPTETKLRAEFDTAIPLLAIDPVRINKKSFDRNEHERIL